MKRILQHLTTALYYFLYPLLIKISKNSSRSRVVIFSPSGKIIVVKNWISSGKWHLPGGGRRKNEDSGQGAAREVLEETKLEVNPSELEFIKQLKFNERGKKWILDIFKISLKSEPSLSPLWYEISEVRWIDPKELNEDNASGDLLVCLKNCYNKDYV